MRSEHTAKLDIQALLDNGFTEKTANLLYDQGREVAVFVMLALAALALKDADSNDDVATNDADSTDIHPSTPSATVPPYQKEPGKKRKRKPGAKPGHKGHRRAKPAITHREEHRAACCPDCGGDLRKRKQTRTRLIEDIPKDIKPEVTEHTIHRDYCPQCRKNVEPVVPDAMPNAQIGNRTVVLSAFLHYFVGITISKIVEIFNTQFQFKLTSGGLINLWHNLAFVLLLWYQEIGASARQSAVLHADETGWRVNGKTYWLWCFTNEDVTYYVIDRSRASSVVKRFFKDAFKGTLVTDFYGAYNAAVCADKQKCLVHLLGDLKKVQKYKDTSEDWSEFSKLLKRLVRDAIRLRGRKMEMVASQYDGRCARIEHRLTKLLSSAWKNVEAKRLVKRLHRHRDEVFVFLYRDGVPSDNNFAERVIRNGVVMRKNSYCNRSLNGAKTQAVLMSVFATLKQRGIKGTDCVVEAVRNYIKTGKLPKMPQKKQTAE
jgi:transposase